MMARPALSDEPVLLLNPSLEERVPDITAEESKDIDISGISTVLAGIENNLDRSLSLSFDQTNLKWQTFDGSLPNGAVSIYNEYVERIDYVSKYGSQAGFYNPDMGPHCRYPYGEKEYLGSPFEILVNKDDFEFLEWKDGSYGSVPPNSVKTVSNNDIYVGKNRYGLGKVDVKNQAFFLPWKGSEYWYKTYQVLTFNKDIYSEDISDVKYKTDGVAIIKHPPETMTKATLVNKDCHAATLTATLSTKIQVEQRWDTSFSLTVGIKTTITAGIPIIASTEIEISASTTFQFTKGTTYTESKEHQVAVECKVPPNHSCSVSLVGYKYEADIPYTARLHRKYSNGDTTWTSISGTYKRVQVMEVQSEVDRCEPLPDAKPCA
ncbi:natterin-3-like [Anarrhichthys ocellatus]|uniref:natterin-3-like n=1 Tax=Anarrhichthys ocellatus TaxID=433405 RepID=UPI0012ED4B83|nr:natterin-3-like [Anarrhichthys ocellatus]